MEGFRRASGLVSTLIIGSYVVLSTLQGYIFTEYHVTGACRSLFYESPSEVNWWLDKSVSLLVLYLVVALVAYKPTLILKLIVFFTVAKFLATLVIVVAGFVYLANGHTENIAGQFAVTLCSVHVVVNA